MPDDEHGHDEQGTAWSWDPSLYAGSARHYAIGRVPYPDAMVQSLVDALSLDGTGTLLDVGCGPGSVTLLLAPHVRSAVGVDADPDMLAEAARLAGLRGIDNVVWRQLRAEQLPAGLPRVRVITLAQSFHWMDRPRVAAILRTMLEPGGTLVHVSAETQEGDDPEDVSAPPWEAVENLVASYLGAARRAGRGVRPPGRDDEDTVYRTAGFSGPQSIQVPGWRVERTVDQIVASVHSLSWAAPHLFGERLADFDAELRDLLDASPANGRFTETMRSIRLDLWR